MKNIRSCPVHHYTSEGRTLKEESIAEETLVRIMVNGAVLVQLLGSPEHAKELAIGHLMTQHGHQRSHVTSVETSIQDGAIEVTVTTSTHAITNQRHGIVTSSCGACDQSGLTELIKVAPIVSNPSVMFDLEAIIQRLHSMRDQQTGFQLTGGMHAAGVYATEHDHLVVMEDIGRHNAVDKVYGAWYEVTTERPNVLLLSGRCGWDIVAKAAAMDTAIIACFGAASRLAVDTARAANMTLITFVRGEKANIIGPVEGRFHRKH